MPLDAVCLQAVVAELAPQITGSRIEKIQQPARDQVVLLLRGNRRLLLSAGGESRKFLLCHCEGRYLVRRRGQVIKQPRQHLPVGVHLKVDAAQTVDDVSVPVRQYQVGAAGNGL